MDKPTKKEIDKYLWRKFGPTCSELTPRNFKYELEDGYEFAYITTIGGKKGITIKKKK